MEGDDPWLVVTTVATREQAQALARELVGQRLAACVHVEAMESIYRWQDSVHEETEYRLTCKTRRALDAELQAMIARRHPYEQPVIEAFAVSVADAATLQWLAEATST